MSPHLEKLKQHIEAKARRLGWAYVHGRGRMLFSVPGGGYVNFAFVNFRTVYATWTRHLTAPTTAVWVPPLNKSRRRAQKLIDRALAGLKGSRP